MVKKKRLMQYNTKKQHQVNIPFITQYKIKTKESQVRIFNSIGKLDE
jgi:hypothetical protein